MKQSQFYYLLRRGLLKSMSVVKEGLVMFNKFTTAGISHPAQGSAAFDGSSDYIQLDDTFNYTNHTVAAWVYVDSFSSWNAIFAAQDGSSDGIRFSISSDSRIYYKLNGFALYPSTTISANKWYHIAASYEGSNLRVYLDGSLLGTSTQTTTIDNSTDATIGTRSDNYGDKMDGNLSNVAFWNRALSSDEINSVMWKGYQSLTDNEKSGLQAWYSLDDVASPAASLATMEALAVDKDATIENKAAVTAAVNALS